MEKIRKKIKNVFIPHIDNTFQPEILKPKNLFILAVVLLVIKFLVFSWFFYFPKTAHFAIITSSRLVELTNKERTAQGLQPLKINRQLVEAAQEKVQDMINNNYFAHTSPMGITPWHWFDVTNYKYTVAGENLAKGFSESEFVHQAWMDSSSHRANILNGKYQEIGIAVAEGEINGEKTVLAVQLFGSSFVPTKVEATEEKKPTENKPLVASDTKVEIPEPKSISEKEIGGEEAPKSVLNIVTEKSESFVQKIYFIVLGVLVLVLFLTIFINIRVQYPKLIFIALIFIILIAAIACFNGQEFLNRGIDIL